MTDFGLLNTSFMDWKDAFGSPSETAPKSLSASAAHPVSAAPDSASLEPFPPAL